MYTSAGSTISGGRSLYDEGVRINTEYSAINNKRKAHEDDMVEESGLLRAAKR